MFFITFNTYSQTYLLGTHYQKNSFENFSNITLNFDNYNETYGLYLGFEAGTTLINLNKYKSSIIESGGLFNDKIKIGCRIGKNLNFINFIGTLGVNLLKQYNLIYNSRIYGEPTGKNFRELYYKFSTSFNMPLTPELGFGSDGISLGVVYRIDP